MRVDPPRRRSGSHGWVGVLLASGLLIGCLADGTPPCNEPIQHRFITTNPLLQNGTLAIIVLDEAEGSVVLERAYDVSDQEEVQVFGPEPLDRGVFHARLTTLPWGDAEVEMRSDCARSGLDILLTAEGVEADQVVVDRFGASS